MLGGMSKVKSSAAFLLLLASLSGCAAGGSGPVAPTRPACLAQPRALVVWVSVDGFRPDYLARADAPFLKGMKQRGAWTDQLVPPYPSLTFASHSSEATGASPAVHGIPGNSFYDRKLDREFNFPFQNDLLRAEPIWTAATKQGRRVAVFDWPFSQAERGSDACAYFADAYDSKMTDAGRLQRVDDVLRYDPAVAQPVSLAMGYVEGVDHAGHDVGPGGRAPVEQLERIDKLLAALHERAVATLKERFPAGSTLYFLVSTDHGMTQVKTSVNVKAILKDALPAGAHVVTGGGTGHVFVPAGPERQAQLRKIREVLAAYPFIEVYTRETMPHRWHMYDADRVGDLYLNLPAGYTFNNRGGAVVNLAAEGTTRPGDRAPRGMHSYDPMETREMLGFTAVSRYPQDFGGEYLGHLDNRRLAPTVAAWLGIAPPAQCEVQPLGQLTP